MNGAVVRVNKQAIQGGGVIVRGRSSTRTVSAEEPPAKLAVPEKGGDPLRNNAGWSTGCGAIVVRSRGRILLLSGCGCEPGSHTGC